MKIFNLLILSTTIFLLGCHPDYTNCMSNTSLTGCDEFYRSFEKSNYPTCSYEPTHYFFCDVESKSCNEYINLTTTYFIETEARESVKQKYIADGPFSEFIEKIRKNEEIFCIGNHDDGISSAPPFVVQCKNSNLELEFVIFAKKISDDHELRELHFVIGESPNEERPRPQEILQKYCPDGGTDCLEAFITDYRLQEPKNKQEIYMFGIISRGNSKEHNAVLQGLYDRIQQSDILFRGQMLGTRLICASLAKKNEVTIKDKIPLRLNFEESLKQLEEERKNEERKKIYNNNLIQ